MGYVARVGEKTNAYWVFVVKFERRPSFTGEDNIKTDVKDKGWDNVV
jgi:hypothetical protein